MKLSGLSLLALVTSLMSCSNELDLLNIADPIPVVYFVMNPDEPAYHLTLTKSFSGVGNGYDLARDPDRVFYQSADIRMEGWMDEYKVWETKFNLTDKIKNPGIFPESSGYCYESPNDFYPNQNVGILPNGYHQITHFRLVLNLEGALGPILATIPLIPMPQRKFPATPLKVLDINPDGSNYKAVIKFDPDYVKYCELVCLFRYQEYQYDRTWLDYSVTFQLRKNIMIIDDEAATFIDSDLFLNKLAVNIKPVNDTITRKFKSLDLIFYVGDQNYADYNNSYINTGNNDAPPIGNISNGYGMFTMARTIKIEKNMIMSPRTLELVSSSAITKKLGFVRW